MDYRLGIHPDTLQAMSGPYFWPVVAVHADWPGDPVHVHSGEGILDWQGVAWRGVGYAGGVTLPSDQAGMQVGRGMLTLGGDPETITELLSDANAAQGRAVEVIFGVASERAGTELIGELFGSWKGFMAEATETEDWNGEIVRFEVQIALESGPPPRAYATTLHDESERIRADPDTAFPDTSGRHFRGILNRAQNASLRQ